MTTFEHLSTLVRTQGLHDAQGQTLESAVLDFKVAVVSVKNYLDKLMNGTIEVDEFVTEVEIAKLKENTNSEKFAVWLQEYQDVEGIELTDYPKAYSVSVAIFYMYEVFSSTHEEKRAETTDVFDTNYPFNTSFDDFMMGLEAPEED